MDLVLRAVFDADAFGQRFQELRAVFFLDDARIQHHDGSGVRAAADQPSEALFEFEDGFWELVFVERVAVFF